MSRSQWYVFSRVLVCLAIVYALVMAAVIKSHPAPVPSTPASAQALRSQLPKTTVTGGEIPAERQSGGAANASLEVPENDSTEIMSRAVKPHSAFREQVESIAAPGKQALRRLVWPIESTYITSPFGTRLDPVAGASVYVHRGVDVRGDCGTPVVAAMDGEVIFAELTKGSGNCVRVAHPGGMITRYAHLSRADVSVGDRVTAGQKLGVSGATGHTTGPHLHFEIWIGKRPINPLVFKYKHLPSNIFGREEVGAACNNAWDDEYLTKDSSWGVGDLGGSSNPSLNADLQGLMRQYEAEIGQ